MTAGSVAVCSRAHALERRCCVLLTPPPANIRMPCWRASAPACPRDSHLPIKTRPAPLHSHSHPHRKLEAAGITSLGQLLSCYPRRLLVSQPGVLPEPRDDGEKQPVLLAVRCLNEPVREAAGVGRQAQGMPCAVPGLQAAPGVCGRATHPTAVTQASSSLLAGGQALRRRRLCGGRIRGDTSVRPVAGSRDVLAAPRGVRQPADQVAGEAPAVQRAAALARQWAGQELPGARRSTTCLQHPRVGSARRRASNIPACLACSSTPHSCTTSATEKASTGCRRWRSSCGGWAMSS